MGIVTTRAILLRAHPYSESSRVLRFLTEDHGVVGVMGRGVRKGGRGEGLDLFAETSLTLHVKPGRDLQTLRETSTVRDRRRLGGHPLRLAAAGVLAELVLRHHGEAPGADVYAGLSRGLDDLESAEVGAVVPVLLARGWVLVALLGFHPQVEGCVRCGTPLGPDEVGRFDFEAGGVRCSRCTGEMAGPRIGPGARGQLTVLLRGGVPDVLRRPRANLQLLSDFITHHVSGTRPLEAFRMLSSFLPPEDPGERLEVRSAERAPAPSGGTVDDA
ncbi:MAG TPA: DNA repair protein RecO [Longimicrobiales bacterium]|nr:DNA repair protein RecO [Longimicrobiales bacterium]